MNICITSRLYGMVSHDITNHCNARCKFCFNDWKKLHSCNMENEILKKTRSIIPFCNQELFLFSCLFEPTLHPAFLKMLYMIPYQYRDKVFFTTNLVRKMSDDELVALCNAPVKYFNVSLETYDRNKYKFLSGTKQSDFFDNISRLGRIAKSLGKNNKIRIITMILRSNMNEIIQLIERVHREISPIAHELRTPYVSGPIEDFLSREMLDKEELYILYEKINSLGYDEVVLDLGRNQEVFQGHLERKYKLGITNVKEYDNNSAYRVRIEPNGLETLGCNTEKTKVNDFTYRVRINSDGTGYFVDTDEEFDLHDVEDATLFWSEKLREIQEVEAEQYVIKEESLYEVELYTEEVLHGELTDILIFDEEFLTIQGYYQDCKSLWKEKERVLLLVQNDSEGLLLSTQVIKGMNGDCTGFRTKVAKKRLDTSLEIDVLVGYKDDNVLHMMKLATLPVLKQFFR